MTKSRQYELIRQEIYDYLEDPVEIIKNGHVVSFSEKTLDSWIPNIYDFIVQYPNTKAKDCVALFIKGYIRTYNL